MKAIISLIAILGFAGLAHADGFVCTSESGVVLRVFDHVHAEQGTRTAAVMTVSDSYVGHGRKTIARFSDVNQTLSSQETVYTAKVDLRFNDSARKGENIGGTKLGQLSTITLAVDFWYNAPVENGASVAGTMTLDKRNGDSLHEEVSCVRYLKN